MKKVLILGAGFGGLETATGLSAVMKGGYAITLVDKSDSFFVGFSKIDVLFGRRTEAEVRCHYANLRAEGVRFVQASITAIDTDSRTVTTTAGAFGYDYLVIALGADLDHDATPGYRDSGGYEFYSMAGAVRLRPVLQAFGAGSLVLGILGVPYKCPPAPYEVACQMHELFIRHGIRDRVQMKMVIPSPRPVPNPNVSGALEKLLAERGIELLASSPIRSIDVAHKQVIIGERSVAYDLFVGVPVHVPPAVVRASKVGASGYVQPSLTNLETSIPGVYAVGDITKLPAGEHAVPKAGAFAEDAARTVVSDILVAERLANERVKFEAKGACYFEIDHERVGKVSANFFGGDNPWPGVEGPSSLFQADKLQFESSRRARWFK